MDKVPTPKECIELLKKQGCSEAVITHCKAVRDVAVRIAKKANANVELVEAGALLHDIGRSKTHGIRHAIEGVKIAKELGLPESIIKIIESHIGAGLSADVAKSIGLPKKDYVSITLEEKIVCHADNLIDNCKFQPIEVEVERALREGHKDYAMRLVKLHKELSDICGMDLNNI
ncbi:MAG: HDIG domain-containing protein [Candidatus Thermoplasmatota archaeon]|nr:HDIG domain-containing protein [Candidatus Thermoplasmatota archaeon]